MATPIIYLNGLFWALNKAKVSIHDRGFAYGDGLFETLRTYSNKIFRLDDHLNRLIESSQKIFLELPMTRREISSAMYATTKINRLPDSIIRITVTRGVQDPGININHKFSPTIVIHARPIISIPESTYKNGATIWTEKRHHFRRYSVFLYRNTLYLTNSTVFSTLFFVEKTAPFFSKR